MNWLRRIAPLEFNQKQLRHLGAVALAGAVITVWWLYTPAGLLGKADALAYSVCHRIELRSFHLGERPIPLCARCSGMYLGALFAILYFAVSGRGRAGRFPGRSVVAVFVLFVLAFAVDGVNSFLDFLPGAPTLYSPNNTLRLITGTGLGLGLGTFLYAGFNQNAWAEWKRQAPLKDLKSLLPLLLVGVAVILLVLSENDLILYPLALLSGASVLVLLGGVYTVLALLVLRRENSAQGWLDLIPPAALGLTLAIVQIGVIDLARYISTGTWSGFTI